MARQVRTGKRKSHTAVKLNREINKINLTIHAPKFGRTKQQNRGIPMDSPK